MRIPLTLLLSLLFLSGPASTQTISTTSTQRLDHTAPQSSFPLKPPRERQEGAAEAAAPAVRNVEAIGLCLQVLAAHFSAPVKDFKASGEITYYVADKETSAPIEISGLAPRFFQMTASTSEGKRATIVASSLSNYFPGCQDCDKHKQPLPGLKIWTVPYFDIVEIARNQTYQVTVAPESANGRILYRIRVDRRQFVPAQVFRPQSFYIDPEAKTVVIAEDEIQTSFPIQVLQRRIEYADYRRINGVSVPFTVTEFVNNQRTWSVQLAQIEFDVGITRSMFDGQ